MILLDTEFLHALAQIILASATLAAAIRQRKPPET